jgi:hypothetical protein
MLHELFSDGVSFDAFVGVVITTAARTLAAAH